MPRHDVFDAELQCRIASLAYDFPAKRGRVVMAECNCVDMAGCIRKFLRIDRSVAHIETMTPEGQDTQYFRVDDRWRAVMPNGRVGDWIPQADIWDE